MKRIAALVLALVLSIAFQTKTREDLIREDLDEKVAAYRREQVGNCRERILEKANQIVDSLIIEYVRANRDTLDRPFRTDKPGLPELLFPQDTTPVAPLFDSVGG